MFSYKILKLAFIIVIIFCINFILLGCAVRQGKVYEKDGKLYGKIEGLFKEKWNDYYLRGYSYTEGEFWEDAALDFIEAIRQKGKDQRRVRTYGLHFMDYFPNRELGIAYFFLGKFKEAIKTLDASLASVETARAKYYLNRARKGWLDESRLDTLPPVLITEFPPPGYVTNEFAIKVRGTARDNFYVSRIFFNGRSLPLELSRKEVSFKEEISLRHGQNRITLQAEDLMGKTSEPIILTVKVDREGPLVFLEGRQDAMGDIIIEGAVYDKSAVSKVTLNDRELVVEQGRLIKINERFQPQNISDKEKMLFKLEDIAGNRTGGHIDLTAVTKERALSNYPRIAFAQSADGRFSLPKMRLPTSASLQYFASSSKTYGRSAVNSIELKGLIDLQTVYYGELFIEGSVTAPAGIKDISINGQSLLDTGEDESLSTFLKELTKMKKRSLSFSKLIKLEEGENAVTIGLTDGNGKFIQKTIHVIRKVPKVRQIGSRLSVTVYPFKEKNATAESLVDYTQAFISHAFVEQQRFNVLERDELNKLIEEQLMSQEDVFAQETAVRLGRMMASETILLGDIFVTDRSVEIVARMVDTETSLILAEKDVYWEGKNRTGFREILDGLALKFRKHFPLCEGMVIGKNADEVIINLGKDDALCRGMRLLAFKDSGSIVDLATGNRLGTETDVLGLISAWEINDKFSKGNIIKKFTEQEIEIKHKVITK